MSIAREELKRHIWEEIELGFDLPPIEMTATEFRRAYGVPIHTLPHVRQSLSMEREALREVYGDHWREDWEGIAQEFNEDDESEGESDSLTLEGGDLLTEARGWRRSLTAELVEGLED